MPRRRPRRQTHTPKRIVFDGVKVEPANKERNTRGFGQSAAHQADLKSPMKHLREDDPYTVEGA